MILTDHLYQILALLPTLPGIANPCIKLGVDLSVEVRNDSNMLIGEIGVLIDLGFSIGNVMASMSTWRQKKWDASRGESCSSMQQRTLQTDLGDVK